MKVIMSWVVIGVVLSAGLGLLSGCESAQKKKAALPFPGAAFGISGLLAGWLLRRIEKDCGRDSAALLRSLC